MLGLQGRGAQGQAILLDSLLLSKLARRKLVPTILPFFEDRPLLPPVVVVSGSLSFVDIDLYVAPALLDLLEGAQWHKSLSTNFHIVRVIKHDDTYHDVDLQPPLPGLHGGDGALRDFK